MVRVELDEEDEVEDYYYFAKIARDISWTAKSEKCFVWHLMCVAFASLNNKLESDIQFVVLS